jgi:hypothetical protein
MMKFVKIEYYINFFIIFSQLTIIISMKGAAQLITLLLLSSSHDSVRADQPVHCLRENMYGLWDFHVSTDT